MIFKKFIFLLLASLLFSACGQKKYDKQESILLVFKTAVFKHNDLAFLYENAQSLKIEVYSNGQAGATLSLDQNSICLSFLECMSNQKFNTTVLNAAYPEQILMNILRGRSIFSGQNISRMRNGFTQKIVKEGKYAIDYSVLNNDILFFDKINGIYIKVQRL